MQEKENKIILDTNLWISFLLSKDYSRLDNLIFNKNSKLIFSSELIKEFITVANRPKFKKYFDSSDLKALLRIFDTYGYLIKVHSKVTICRDYKDNFLLALAIDSEADFLLSGDKDILALNKIGRTKIMTISQFEKLK